MILTIRPRRGLMYLVIGLIFSVSMVIGLGGPYDAFSELVFHINLDIQEWKVHLLIIGLALIIWGGLKMLMQKS